MKKPILSLALFLPSVFLAKAAWSADRIVDRIVAIMNNEIILESDIKNLEKSLSQEKPLDEFSLLNLKAEDLKTSRKSQIDYLINEKIFDSEIKRLNLSITQAAVDDEIREIAKRNQMKKEELFVALKNQGMDQAEYQNLIRSKKEKTSLIETEITTRLRISEDEIYSECQRTIPQVKNAVQEFTVANLFFNPKKGGESSAQERAKAAYERLKGGENFEVVAERYSEDPNFTAGGLLGTFKSGEFSAELEASIKDVDVGQLSPVTKAKNGFYILKVLAKKSVRDPLCDKKKDELRAKLFDRAFQKQLKNWLESKKEDSFVKINHPV